MGTSYQENEKMHTQDNFYKTEELTLKGEELAILEKKNETNSILKTKQKAE